MSRHDFKKNVKDTIKRTTGYICSNPSCRVFLWDQDFKGKVAHIVAASKNGPRASLDHGNDKSNIVDESNGLVLCLSCEKFVDSNPNMFTAELLYQWKDDTIKLFDDFCSNVLPSELPPSATIPKTIFRDNPGTITKFEQRIKALEKLAQAYKQKADTLDKKNKTLTEMNTKLTQQHEQLSEQFEQNQIDNQTDIDHLTTEHNNTVSKLQSVIDNTLGNRIYKFFMGNYSPEEEDQENLLIV